MDIGTAGGFAKLLNDVRRRGQVGIAHAKVDDIRAFGAKKGLLAIDLLENVGRKTPDLVKIQTHDASPVLRLDGAGPSTCRNCGS